MIFSFIAGITSPIFLFTKTPPTFLQQVLSGSKFFIVSKTRLKMNDIICRITYILFSPAPSQGKS